MGDSDVTPEAKEPPGESPFAVGASDSPTTLGSSFGARRTVVVAAVALLVFFALVNCAGVPIAESIPGPSGWEIVIALGFGVIGGQIGALSGMLVWSKGPFLIRSLAFWLLGIGLYVCWLLGLLTAIRDDLYLSDMWKEVARAILASLPMVSLAVQLPQWALRFYFGWRIASPLFDDAADTRHALSIRDILTGTVIVALTVTAIRFAFADLSDFTATFWFGWAIAVGVLGTLSAIMITPLLYLILRGYRPALAILFILIAAPVVAGTVIGITKWIVPGGPDVWGVVMLMLAGTVCVATTSAPVWIARLAGYRLKIGRE